MLDKMYELSPAMVDSRGAAYWRLRQPLHNGVGRLSAGDVIVTTGNPQLGDQLKKRVRAVVECAGKLYLISGVVEHKGCYTEMNEPSFTFTPNEAGLANDASITVMGFFRHTLPGPPG